MNAGYVFVAICLWFGLLIWACNFPSYEKKRKEIEENWRKYEKLMESINGRR